MLWICYILHIHWNPAIPPPLYSYDSVFVKLLWVKVDSAFICFPHNSDCTTWSVPTEFESCSQSHIGSHLLNIIYTDSVKHYFFVCFSWLFLNIFIENKSDDGSKKDWWFNQAQKESCEKDSLTGKEKNSYEVWKRYSCLGPSHLIQYGETDHILPYWKIKGQ